MREIALDVILAYEGKNEVLKRDMDEHFIKFSLRNHRVPDEVEVGLESTKLPTLAKHFQIICQCLQEDGYSQCDYLLSK